MCLSHSRLRAAAGLCLLLSLEGVSTRAAVEVLPEVKSAAVFGGGRRSIRVLFSNPDEQAAQADLRWRLYQASAGSLAPLGETRPWRAVPLGAGQTVVETVELDLPGVRGEIAFHIVWFDGERKVGTTPLR